MSSTNATLAGRGGTRPRLLVDSDDDMDGDDDSDDDLLVMPTSPHKLELHIDQTLTGPTGDFPSLDVDATQAPYIAPPVSKAENSVRAQAYATPQHADEDDLFGEDFMEQFGKDGEIEFELNQTKGPIFPRRIPLLEATEQVAGEGETDDLGLDRLSISQKHRTRSGAPILTETTKTTYTATSSTTIISNLPSRFKIFNRSSAPLFSQESSQLEEELLEMSDRQLDALLEDDLLREEEGLRDILDMQYREQDQQQQQTLPMDRANGAADNNKRKHPVTVEAGKTPAVTTAEEIDQFLEESYAVGNSALGRAVETSKKTRLEYASTGSSSTRGTVKQSMDISVLNLAKRLRVPEASMHDYTLPPETGSFIKAKSNSGQTFYLAKRVKVESAKVR